MATVDVVAAVFERVASEAKRQNDGRAPSRVILTHPATWHEPRRATLTEAAGRAGLEPVELLPEPVAAALMYAEIHSLDAPVAVYDLGGTFDVTVVEATDQGIRVKGAPKGIDPLGGSSFDQKLFEVLEPDSHSSAPRGSGRGARDLGSPPSASTSMPTYGPQKSTLREQLMGDSCLGTVVLVTRTSSNSSSVRMSSAPST